MTDCNPGTLTFSRIGSKAVVADFGGGRLTTDAGALLLREVADRLGLFEALDAAIPDPRHPAFILHDQKAMLAQRVTAIALGYEDLNDHQTLRADPALQVAASKLPDGAWPRRCLGRLPRGGQGVIPSRPEELLPVGSAVRTDLLAGARDRSAQRTLPKASDRGHSV